MAQQPPEGVVTVLFTDIVGSAALKTSQGDAAAQKLVRGHFDLLRQQVESHRGREVKTLGDALIAPFASPRRALPTASPTPPPLADGHPTQPPTHHAPRRAPLPPAPATHQAHAIS